MWVFREFNTLRYSYSKVDTFLVDTYLSKLQFLFVRWLVNYDVTLWIKLHQIKLSLQILIATCTYSNFYILLNKYEWKKVITSLLFFVDASLHSHASRIYNQLNWRNQLSNPVHNCYDVNLNRDLMEVFQLQTVQSVKWNMRMRINVYVREVTDWQGCSLESKKYQGYSARSYRLKEIGINHTMKSFSSYNTTLTLFNA
jgi:hypothetical protein